MTKGCSAMSMVRRDTPSYVAAERANAVERCRLEQKFSILEKEYRRTRAKVINRREEAREELRQLRLETNWNFHQSTTEFFGSSTQQSHSSPRRMARRRFQDSAARSFDFEVSNRGVNKNMHLLGKKLHADYLNSSSISKQRREIPHIHRTRSGIGHFRNGMNCYVKQGNKQKRREYQPGDNKPSIIHYGDLVTAIFMRPPALLQQPLEPIDDGQFTIGGGDLNVTDIIPSPRFPPIGVENQIDKSGIFAENDNTEMEASRLEEAVEELISRPVNSPIDKTTALWNRKERVNRKSALPAILPVITVTHSEEHEQTVPDDALPTTPSSAWPFSGRSLLDGVEGGQTKRAFDLNSSIPDVTSSRRSSILCSTPTNAKVDTTRRRCSFQISPNIANLLSPSSAGNDNSGFASKANQQRGTSSIRSSDGDSCKSSFSNSGSSSFQANHQDAGSDTVSNSVTSGLTSFQGVTSYNGVVTSSGQEVTPYHGISKQPVGWKKIQKHLGAILSLNDSSGGGSGSVGAVNAQLTKRRNSSVKLLRVLEQLNASRTTAQLLEMDKERKRLAEKQDEEQDKDLVEQK